VVVTDANGDVLCTAIIMAGSWSCVSTQPLPEGMQDVTVSTTDLAGNVADSTVNITISDDFDGDGISNSAEGTGDRDGDGVLDAEDLDSDNDGLPDSVEGTADTDGDGLPDYIDADADNDGIADVVEAEGDDFNADYSIDDFVDNNGNGLSDDVEAFPLSIPDTDGDGIPNYLDVDSDQDGVPDIIESQGIDQDNDGRIDDVTDINNNGVDDATQLAGALPLDTDGDGVPNYLDSDSDNDGISDIIEAGISDVDGDNRVDSWADDDADGIPDSVDVDYTGGIDDDLDGIDDQFDHSIVGGVDFDFDGIIDSADPDANGDGYADDPALGQSLPDRDDNGVPDIFQVGVNQLRTGLAGRGGCSVLPSQGSSQDTLLVLLLVLAMLRLCWMAGCRQRATGASFFQVAILMIGLLLASNTMADEMPEKGFKKRFYGGGGIGASYLEPDASEIPFRVIDRVDRAFTVFLGVDLSQRFSADSLSAILYGLNPKVCRKQRLGLSAFGRLGISNMKNSADIAHVREHDQSVLFGFGLEYGWKRGLALRAEAISFDVDAHFAGISLLHRFGKKSHQTPLVVPAVSKQPVVPPIVADENPVANQSNVDQTPVSQPDLQQSFVMLFAHNGASLDVNTQSETTRLAYFLKTPSRCDTQCVAR